MSEPHADSGGPAFPQPCDWYPGMSLRDYFAAHAPIEPIAFHESSAAVQLACDECYRYADAMLEARKR